MIMNIQILSNQDNFRKRDTDRGCQTLGPGENNPLPDSVETHAQRVRFFELVTGTNQDFISFELSPSVPDEPDELLDLLLSYFDQIVYLKEISEKLGKLETAIVEENIGRVNFIARECAALGANCGMVTVIEPLRRLERLKNKSQLVNARALNGEVRKELASFNRAVKENLEKLTTQVRINNLSLQP